jgi:hypothetical protein
MPASRIRGALVLAGALLTPSVGPAAPFASTYTRHDFHVCPARPSSHPGVVEVRRCRGLAGFPVVWTNEPDASWLDFAGKADANGTVPGLDTFYAVRGTIEWRGPTVGSDVRPVAAIVRYDTGPSIRLGASRLVIYRLAQGRSCVLGVVDAGPNANAAARALVDRAAAGFNCRRSAIRAGPRS